MRKYILNKNKGRKRKKEKTSHSDDLTKKRKRPFIGFMYKGSLLTLNDLIMMLIMTTIKHVHELPNLSLFMNL